MKKLTLLGVLVALTACAPTQPNTVEVQHVQAPVMDVSQHFRIMALGDSVTRGDGSSHGYGYRLTLHSYLRDVGGFGNATMVGSVNSAAGPHEGHPGWTITSLTASVPGWLNTYDPDLVYLYAGLNDAGQGATGDQITDRMKLLIDTILAHSPDIRVVVGDIVIPWGTPALDLQSPALIRYNQNLPTIVSNAGDRVKLAYMSRGIPNNTLGDKIHPNNIGYERMAWIWYRCTASFLAADGVVRHGRDPLPIPVTDLCS